MTFRGVKRRLRRKSDIVLGRLFPAWQTKRIVKRGCGYWPDLKHPKTLNEKMQYLKLNLYSKDPVVWDCIDKYKVRSFVEAHGLGHILPRLYGVWDDVNKIDWDALPDQFAIKCNHGCGFNILCRDKSSFDVADAKARLDKWMHRTFGRERVQMIYDHIQPRIICEEFIETDDGLPPRDYKVFCSFGEPKMVLVAADRYEGKTTLDYFDMDWNWIPVTRDRPNAKEHIARPPFLDEILDAARELTRDFPIVRADFYHEKGKLYFGELTFLHGGASVAYNPGEYDRIFGDLFPLEK